MPNLSQSIPGIQNTGFIHTPNHPEPHPPHGPLGIPKGAPFHDILQPLYSRCLCLTFPQDLSIFTPSSPSPLDPNSVTPSKVPLTLYRQTLSQAFVTWQKETASLASPSVLGTLEAINHASWLQRLQGAWHR
jgi:hypothetical protein